MEKFLIWFIGIIAAIIIIVSMIVVFSIPLFYLWNWLMPNLFGVNKITFIQAIGIHFLSGILFGNYLRFFYTENKK